VQDAKEAQAVADELFADGKLSEGRRDQIISMVQTDQASAVAKSLIEIFKKAHADSVDVITALETAGVFGAES
jgi:hypothetical protein